MKVLFVVTAFYPEQAIGSIRITKLAKYLVAAGVDLTVISLTPPIWSKKDETLKFEGLNNIRWIQVDQSDFFKRIFQRVRRVTIGNASAASFVQSSDNKRSIGTFVRRVFQFSYTAAKAIDWNRQVKRYAEGAFKGEKFDCVFCSYPSLASPMAAFSLRKDGYGSNVVLDFRDPVSYENTGLERIQDVVQDFLVKRADAVTFVSEGVREKIIAGKKQKNRDMVLYNGFDSDDMVGRENFLLCNTDSQVLKFSYVGALYGGKRNLDLFFRAVKGCIDRGVVSSKEIEVHYAGAESGCFLSQAERYGVSDLVVNHGLINRDDALILQARSDINIVVTWNSEQDKGVLTGKVFECFMMRKPVLAIVNGPIAGSELSQIVRTIGAGFCVEDANYEVNEMQQWLIGAIKSKVTDGHFPSTYKSDVNNFCCFFYSC